MSVRALAILREDVAHGRSDAAPEEAGHHALLEACRRGEPDAFGRLFDLHNDRVYSLALHLSGNSADASDVTQDVFLKLLTRLAQFRHDAQFTTWLHRIVVNTWLDRRKARRRFVGLDEPAAWERVQPASQERDLVRAEERRRVAAALQQVREEFRVVLVLRFVSELSYDEIAAVCGLSAGTVASRLSRGLRDLGRALEAPGRGANDPR